MECHPCSPKCETCESESVCTSCSKHYYKQGDECVLQCADGTYADTTSQQCLKCATPCLTCYGGSVKDCKECNYNEGYDRNNGKSECQLIICADGMYAHTDKGIVCLPCDSACKACKGPSNANCTSCSEEYTIMGTGENDTVTCKECPMGYRLQENGKCREVCGDGLNMGEHECDDGNTVSGDGCSSECKVESGFKCHSQDSGPDRCIDIVPPRASLSVKKGTDLTVAFNEDVFIKLNKDSLKSTMQVYLKGGCELTWEIASYKTNERLNKLEIETTPKCSLKASQDYFVVQFNDVSLVTDKDGNDLANSVVEARTMRYVYTADSDLAYSEGLGSIFNSSSFVTLGIMVFIMLFQSVSVGPFWSFINMVQFISYLPALDCELPRNFEIFLTDYMNIRKMAIPVEMLPDFVRAPLDFIEDCVAGPINEKFSLAGYKSMSFISNFLDELLTWFLIGLLYLVLTILCRFVSVQK
eukprot:TRINITY_DN4008_c0_g1_i11.p1 TRINITY_DN4008_c0_g1~~TRINITY_DN4008_c0_g1_i11.p1  ORF type:complete len:471 (-),score=91.94 TRINITY_DN4008_c0_g1_i11:468-1880(-)